MSDIVERLQDTVGSVKWPVSSEMLKEAATEILRLRAENEKLRKWKEEDGAAMRVFERYRELEAEIEKLRTALKPFAEAMEDVEEQAPYAHDCMVSVNDLRAAAAALKETGDE